MAVFRAVSHPHPVKTTYLSRDEAHMRPRIPACVDFSARLRGTTHLWLTFLYRVPADLTLRSVELNTNE